VILGKFWSRFDLQQRRNRKFLGDDQGCLSEQTVLYLVLNFVQLCHTVRLLKHPCLSPKNFRFRCWRGTNIDQNLPIEDHEFGSDLTWDQ
jgi:hypothetical protein